MLQKLANWSTLEIFGRTRTAEVAANSNILELLSAEEREYDAITDEIHRRPGYPVQPPALLRHVSMRFSASDNVGAALHLKTRRETIDAINAYLVDIRRDHVVEDNIGEGRHSRLFSIDLDPRMRLRVRVELHREYASFTFVCDRLAARDNAQELNSDVIGRATDAVERLTHARTSEVTNKSDVAFLYEEFWGHMERVLQFKRLQRIAPFFADFRNVTIVPASCTKAKQPADERFMPDRETQDLRRGGYVDSALANFMKSQQGFVRRVLDIQRDPGDERPSQEANVVLCGMLDGAAIYCSGLGGKIAGQRAPLRNLVVYNGQANRQVGRFLRRLNVLGELRLAALLDLNSLNEASSALVQLGSRVDHLAEMIQAKDANSSDTLVSLYGALTALNRKCVGGLVYRVNQSRHYAHAYQERIQDMRIVRVEGWQAYDAFVRRNLFKTFDWISRVLDRYNQLGQRLDRQGALLQTEEIAANTKTVVEQTHATTDQTKELVYLQYFAETAGALVFVKYGGELLNEFVRPLAKCVLGVAPSGDATIGHNHASSAYLFAMLIYIALRFAWSAVRQVETPAPRRAILLVMTLGALIIAGSSLDHRGCVDFQFFVK